MITILYACLIFLFLQKWNVDVLHFLETLNNGNLRQNWAVSTHFTLTKVKEKVFLVHSKYNNTFFISAETNYSRSDLIKQ